MVKHRLSAAPLVVRSPTIGVPLCVMNYAPAPVSSLVIAPKPKRRKKRKLTPAQKRNADKRRKREERDREAQGRIQITIEPVADDFFVAVENQAMHAHSISDPELAKAIKSIQTNAIGWEDDKKAKSAVATAAFGEWIRRWKHMILGDD